MVEVEFCKQALWVAKQQNRLKVCEVGRKNQTKNGRKMLSFMKEVV